MTVSHRKQLQVMANDGYAPALWAIEEMNRFEGVIKLAADDLSLIVAKTRIGKDRTVIRMSGYLHAEAKVIRRRT